MKRIIILFILSVLIPAALFAAMSAKGVGEPTSVKLEWSRVPNTVWYDIYSGQDFIVRLDANNLSYTVTNLLSETPYSFSIAARDANNNNLDAAFVDATTTCWDGTYTWTNETKDDNKGKMKNLSLTTVHEYSPIYGQYQRVWLSTGGSQDFLFFPIFDFDDPRTNESHKYNEKSESGEAYRANASMVNTSSISPSSWRITKMEFDPNSISLYVDTKALGMITLPTVTDIDFKLDSDGNPYVEMLWWGENNFTDEKLFKNPNPGENGIFVLKKTK